MKVCFMMATHPLSGQANLFSLDEAIDYALTNSNDIRLSQADISIADAQIKEYRASGLPQISASGEYNYFLAIPTQIIPDFLGPAVDGRLLTYSLIDPEQVIPPSGAGIPAQFGLRNSLTFGANASFMIFDASFFSGLKAISKAKDLARREYEQTEFQIKQNVIDAYLLVAFTDKNTSYLESNIENLKKNLEESKALYDNGFIEQLDIDRLELSLQSLEIELEKLSRSKSIAKNLLKFQMNFPLDEDINITDDLDVLSERFQVSEQQFINKEYTYQNRPEYQTIEAGKRLNDLQIENIRSGYYPKLQGFLTYSQQLFRNNLFDGDENGWFPNSIAGATLSIPIYDGSRRKAQITQAKLEREKVLVQQRAFEYAMDLEVTNARENYQNTLATVQNRKKNMDLAERIYDTTVIKYREGVGSSVETSQAERDLYTAQSNYTEAMYDLITATFDLKKALGDL